MRGVFLLVAAVAVSLAGCGGGDPSKPVVNPDDFVEKKVAAMEKIATMVEANAQEPDVIGALEDYRGIPFLPKSQPEAAKKILDIYKKRVAPKAKGEAAIQLKGDMNVLENDMK